MPQPSKSFFVLTLVLSLSLAACSSQPPPPDESQLFKQAMGVKDPAQQNQTLRDFLKQFPKSKNKQRALSQIFHNSLELKQGEQAREAADEYLAGYTGARKMTAYNSFAWQLAQNDLALEVASSYADEAVKMARQQKSRSLSGVLDTQAFIVDKLGDSKRAEEIQREAVAGNPANGTFVGRLAFYEWENGKQDQALQDEARAVLHGSDAKRFQQWLSERYPAAATRQHTKEKIVRSTVAEYLKEGQTNQKRITAAVMMAECGVDAAKAERWARQAIDSLPGDAPAGLRVGFTVRLAQVLSARGRNSEVIDLLSPYKESQQAILPNFGAQFGKALARLGRQEDALQAFATSSLLFTTPALTEAVGEAGISEEALKERIDKMKEELLKFRPEAEKPAASKTGRVALAELFTGAQCGPCVAADRAFDLMADYYPRTSLAILEYHVHVPGPDPMTNDDSEDRYQFYGGHLGTPTVFFDGTERITGGGTEVMKKFLFERYDEITASILKKKTAIRLAVHTRRSGDTVGFTVDASPVADVPADAALHVALVEKSIQYSGSNGITHHRFVVRKLVNGSDGIPLDLTSGEKKIENSIDLTQVDAALSVYLNLFEAHPPKRFSGFGGWDARPEELDRSNLALVVWIQNTKTKEVYEAAYSDVS